MTENPDLAQTCPKCGTQIPDHISLKDGLCAGCGDVVAEEDGLHIGSSMIPPAGQGRALGEIGPSGDLQQARDIVVEGFSSGNLPEHQLEPPAFSDRKGWSIPAAVGVWLFSVGTLLIVPVIAVGFWYVTLVLLRKPVPSSPEEMVGWLVSPPIILVQVLSTMIAHLLTLGFIWVVVTGMGRRPFLEGLRWPWPGRSTPSKMLYILGVVGTVFAILFVLGRFLPQDRETQFDQLLKTSSQVRYAVAFLAIFTAPLVEEAVYRGVLFSALRSRIGVNATVIIISLLFTGVHMFQYWGAWAGLTGLAILSFTLTIIRARTDSLFPCVAVHLLFNSVSALSLIFQR